MKKRWNKSWEALDKIRDNPKNGKARTPKGFTGVKKLLPRRVHEWRLVFLVFFLCKFFFLGQAVSPPAVTWKTVLHAVRFLQGNAKPQYVAFLLQKATQTHS